MRRNRRLLIAIWSAVLATGCQPGSSNVSVTSGPPAASPPVVMLARPAPQTLHRPIEQPATVRPFEEAPLVAKLPGFVKKRLVDIGDRVKGPKLDASGQEIEPGQLLAVLDNPELVEEAAQKQAVARQTDSAVTQAIKHLLSAEAMVTVAAATVREAEAGLKRATASFERWDKESKRINELVRTRTIDEQTRDEVAHQAMAAAAARDEASAKIGTAQATLKRYEAERDKAAADVKAAEAGRDVARADARRIEALLRYTQIRAPFDGIVTKRLVDIGHFLQSMGKPDVLFVVMRLDPVRVTVEIPEVDAAHVKKGMHATVRVNSLNREFTGTVSRNAWALEGEARTLRTEIDVPNPDGILRPGMYAYASVRVESQVAYAVPATGIVKQTDAHYCFMVVDGKAVRTRVQIGRTDGKQTELLRKQAAGGAWEDITGSDQVIASIPAGLSDGQPVSLAASPK